MILLQNQYRFLKRPETDREVATKLNDKGKDDGLAGAVPTTGTAAVISARFPRRGLRKVTEQLFMGTDGNVFTRFLTVAPDMIRLSSLSIHHPQHERNTSNRQAYMLSIKPLN